MGQGLAQGSDFIQPNIDIFDLLAVSKRKTASLGPIAVSIGTTDLLTVPKGEIWKIRGGGAHFSSAAGETFTNLYPIVRCLDMVSFFGAGDNRVPLTGALNQAASSIQSVIFPVGQLYLPGSVFGYSVAGVVGNPTITLVLMIEVLSV